DRATVQCGATGDGGRGWGRGTGFVCGRACGGGEVSGVGRFSVVKERRRATGAGATLREGGLGQRGVVQRSGRGRPGRPGVGVRMGASAGISQGGWKIQGSDEGTGYGPVCGVGEWSERGGPG